MPPRRVQRIRNDRRYPIRSGSSSAEGGGGRMRCFNGPGSPVCKVESLSRRRLRCSAVIQCKWRPHRGGRWQQGTGRPNAVNVPKYGKTAIWAFGGRGRVALVFQRVSLNCRGL